MLVPFVVEDGGVGLDGEQSLALLRLLAERADASAGGHIRTPETWGALTSAALVSHIVDAGSSAFLDGCTLNRQSCLSGRMNQPGAADYVLVVLTG